MPIERSMMNSIRDNDLFIYFGGSEFIDKFLDNNDPLSEITIDRLLS